MKVKVCGVTRPEDARAAAGEGADAIGINLWLASHQDQLPKSLALDGKDLGHGMGGIVTLCRHEDGRPVAMASYSGAKEDCELPVAQKLLESNAPSLANATITSDALHTQKNKLPNQCTRG